MDRPDPCASSPSREMTSVGRPWRSTSRDAYHAAMPTVAIHLHAVRFAQSGLLVKPTKNAVHDAPLFFLTLSIQLIQPARNLPGTLHVFLVEKVDHVAGHVHASGSVQARRDAETNFGRGQRPSVAK